MTSDALCTPAWLLVGITGSVPGVLELAAERLAFTTEEGRVFDAPLSELKVVNFPWYYFGGGAKFKIGAESYRLSFVRPNDAGDIPAHLLARTGFGGGGAFLKVLDIGEGRRAGKAWKSILAARTSSQNRGR